jgi:hypothetical protein
VLDKIKSGVGQARQAISNMLPPMRTHVPAFEKRVAELTEVPAELQKEFPTTAGTNPAIQGVIDELMGKEAIDPSQALQMIRRYKEQASANFRVQHGDNAANAHALALVQMRAADALEELITNSVATAPADLSSALKATSKSLAETKAAITRERGIIAKQQPLNPGMVSAAQARLAPLTKRMAELTQAEQDLRAKAGRLGALKNRESVAADLKAKRQLAAKSYDVELATNFATGEVSAARLSALRKLGRKLSGGLEKIADAYDSMPQAMRTPTSFGGVEDYSVLDVMSAAYGASQGHIGPVMAALGRPLARSTVLSKPFQNNMLRRSTVDTVTDSLPSLGTPKP